jgi:uncharacterized small protein (TIGR04563 family)
VAGQSRRQALYFPTEMLGELQAQAMRQDRSISWLIQQAWRIGRSELQRVPGTTDYLAGRSVEHGAPAPQILSLTAHSSEGSAGSVAPADAARVSPRSIK